MAFSEPAQELRRIEAFEIMDDSVGGQDDEARVPDVDEEHQDVVEGSVRRRIRMRLPLIVPEIQRRLVSMMAVGNVEGRGIEHVGQLRKGLGPELTAMLFVRPLGRGPLWESRLCENVD